MTKKTATLPTKARKLANAKRRLLKINGTLSYNQAKKGLPWLNSISEDDFNKALKDKGSGEIHYKLVPLPKNSTKKECLNKIEKAGYEPFDLIEVISLSLKKIRGFNGSHIAFVGYSYSGNGKNSKSKFVPVRIKRGLVKGYQVDYVLSGLIGKCYYAVKEK